MAYSAKQRTALKQALTEVLTQTRPEEVFLVGNIFDRPIDVERRSDALGFGMDNQQILLWMYPIFEVLRGLADTAADGFATKWGEDLAEWLWSKKPDARLDSSALTGLRAAVVQRLCSEGVPSQDSERVGDCVLSVLVSQPELVRQIASRK